eukprot:PhF_6_TR40775/c0_g1_i1/m.61512
MGSAAGKEELRRSVISSRATTPGDFSDTHSTSRSVRSKDNHNNNDNNNLVNFLGSSSQNAAKGDNAIRSENTSLNMSDASDMVSPTQALHKHLEAYVTSYVDGCRLNYVRHPLADPYLDLCDEIRRGAVHGTKECETFTATLRNEISEVIRTICLEWNFMTKSINMCNAIGDGVRGYLHNGVYYYVMGKAGVGSVAQSSWACQVEPQGIALTYHHVFPYLYSPLCMAVTYGGFHITCTVCVPISFTTRLTPEVSHVVKCVLRSMSAVYKRSPPPTFQVHQGTDGRLYSVGCGGWNMVLTEAFMNPSRTCVIPPKQYFQIHVAVWDQESILKALVSEYVDVPTQVDAIHVVPWVVRLRQSPNLTPPQRVCAYMVAEVLIDFVNDYLVNAFVTVDKVDHSIQSTSRNFAARTATAKSEIHSLLKSVLSYPRVVTGNHERVIEDFILPRLMKSYQLNDEAAITCLNICASDDCRQGIYFRVCQRTGLIMAKGDIRGYELVVLSGVSCPNMAMRDKVLEGHRLGLREQELGDPWMRLLIHDSTALVGCVSVLNHNIDVKVFALEVLRAAKVTPTDETTLPKEHLLQAALLGLLRESCDRNVVNNILVFELRCCCIVNRFDPDTHFDCLEGSLPEDACIPWIKKVAPLVRLGSELKRLNYLPDAKRALHLAIALENMNGEESFEISIIARNELASLLIVEGAYDEVFDVVTSALTCARRIKGTSPPYLLLADTCMLRGDAYVKRKKNRFASLSYEEALSNLQQCPDSVEVRDTMRECRTKLRHAKQLLTINAIVRIQKMFRFVIHRRASRQLLNQKICEIEAFERANRQAFDQSYVFTTLPKLLLGTESFQIFHRRVIEEEFENSMEQFHILFDPLKPTADEETVEREVIERTERLFRDQMGAERVFVDLVAAESLIRDSLQEKERRLRYLIFRDRISGAHWIDKYRGAMNVLCAVMKGILTRHRFFKTQCHVRSLQRIGRAFRERTQISLTQFNGIVLQAYVRALISQKVRWFQGYYQHNTATQLQKWWRKDRRRRLLQRVGRSFMRRVKIGRAWEHTRHQKAVGNGSGNSAGKTSDVEEPHPLQVRPSCHENHEVDERDDRSASPPYDILSANSIRKESVGVALQDQNPSAVLFIPTKPVPLLIPTCTSFEYEATTLAVREASVRRWLQYKLIQESAQMYVLCFMERCGLMMERGSRSGLLLLEGVERQQSIVAFENECRSVLVHQYSSTKPWAPLLFSYEKEFFQGVAHHELEQLEVYAMSCGTILASTILCEHERVGFVERSLLAKELFHATMREDILKKTLEFVIELKRLKCGLLMTQSCTVVRTGLLDIESADRWDIMSNEVTERIVLILCPMEHEERQRFLATYDIEVQGFYEDHKRRRVQEHERVAKLWKSNVDITPQLPIASSPTKLSSAPRSPVIPPAEHHLVEIEGSGRVKVLESESSERNLWVEWFHFKRSEIGRCTTTRKSLMKSFILEKLELEETQGRFSIMKEWIRVVPKALIVWEHMEGLSRQDIVTGERVARKTIMTYVV